jgi:hypothetical protein
MKFAPAKAAWSGAAAAGGLAARPAPKAPGEALAARPAPKAPGGFAARSAPKASPGGFAARSQGEFNCIVSNTRRYDSILV